VVGWNQSFHLFRSELAYPWPVRVGMVALAIAAALNLLPPAWTPARLATPEFYGQSGALLLALVLVAMSPWLALLPRRLVGGLCVLLCALAVWFPVRDFLRVLPGIAELYNHALRPGWGLFVTVFGLALLGLAAAVVGWVDRQKGTAATQLVQGDDQNPMGKSGRR
jgi:hypothetical protein